MQMPAPNASVLSRKDQIVSRLRGVLPANAVISDVAETRAYECDALTAYRCPPLCAVLPANTVPLAPACSFWNMLSRPRGPCGFAAIS